MPPNNRDREPDLQITVRLSAADNDHLERIALREVDRTRPLTRMQSIGNRSDIVRRAIRQYLERDSAEK